MISPPDEPVAIAEYASLFEAEAAAKALVGQGIEASASSDPARNDVDTYLATDPTSWVIVPLAQVDAALTVLDDDDGFPDAFHDPEVVAWQRGLDEKLARAEALKRRAILGAAILAFAAVLIALGVNLVRVLIA